MNKIALYMRLSVEDKIKKDDSESIISQRSYLHDFVRKDEELKRFSIEEYVDDGYTGTNDKRPSFQRLLEEVKDGKVNTIIVKDLSRFMRDYIALGNYLENIFPFLGVRFIAINDGYDSKKETGNGTDIDIQFKSLLYDFYSKDISQKVKSVSTQLKKQGKFLAWSPPIGYMKDPNDKYKIIVDEKTAWIVRKIYDLALEGFSTRKIAKIMNEEQVPMPSKRKKEITNMTYESKIVVFENKKSPTWTNGTITDILSNENYTGTYVFNMQDRSVLNHGKNKLKSKDKWGRVYNHHQAIISREEFDKVIELKEKNRFMKGKNSDYPWRVKSPLQGVARCLKCNHILGLSENKNKRLDGSVRIHRYFRCRICKCNNISVKSSRVGDIEIQVLAAIKEKFDLKTSEVKKDNNKELDSQIEVLNAKKIQDFEKYKLGKMSKDKFVESKTKIDEEILNLNRKRLSVTNMELKEDTLTKDLVQKYIDSVLCENSIVKKIIWK